MRNLFKPLVLTAVVFGGLAFAAPRTAEAHRWWLRPRVRVHHVYPRRVYYPARVYAHPRVYVRPGPVYVRPYGYYHHYGPIVDTPWVTVW
jgi:hypothetical protein